MPIVINNIGGDPLGVSDYEVCIGEKRITTFRHNRAQGLRACLLAAAGAVEDQQWRDQLSLEASLLASATGFNVPEREENHP